MTTAEPEVLNGGAAPDGQVPVTLTDTVVIPAGIPVPSVEVVAGKATLVTVHPFPVNSADHGADSTEASYRDAHICQADIGADEVGGAGGVGATMLEPAAALADSVVTPNGTKTAIRTVSNAHFLRRYLCDRRDGSLFIHASFGVASG